MYKCVCAYVCVCENVCIRKVKVVIDLWFNYLCMCARAYVIVRSHTPMCKAFSPIT